MTRASFRIAGIASLLLAVPAHAGQADVSSGNTYGSASIQTASSLKKAKPNSGPRVMAYQQRAPEEKVKCLAPVRVVGSQFVTEHGAEESAQKSWMEAVRFDSGEQFMSLDNARDYSRRCARSSVGEIAGQTFYRCEVIAKPCRPLLVLGREK